MNSGVDKFEIKSNNPDSDNEIFAPISIDVNYFNSIKKYIPHFEEITNNEINEFHIRVYEINSDTNKCKAYSSFK